MVIEFAESSAMVVALERAWSIDSVLVPFLHGREHTGPREVPDLSWLWNNPLGA